ncbi:50S ribosomal protein L10, partial [Xanthomonas perforans]
MALNLSQKQEVVAELADIAAKAHSLIAAEYAGTTVSQMTAMRKQARETGVFLKVVKNTLAARAVEGTDFAVAADKLVGPLLYAFSMEEPGAAGRLIKEFAKSNDKLQAKVVSIGGGMFSAGGGRAVGLLAAPAQARRPLARRASRTRCHPFRSAQVPGGPEGRG